VFTDILDMVAASINRAMEAASTSETVVNPNQTTRRVIPEDSHLEGFQNYCHVNFVEIGCITSLCIFLKFYDCEVMMSEKLNARVLLHKDSHLKNDKYHKFCNNEATSIC
jgi:hypothetical protein